MTCTDGQCLCTITTNSVSFSLNGQLLINIETELRALCIIGTGQHMCIRIKWLWSGDCDPCTPTKRHLPCCEANDEGISAMHTMTHNDALVGRGVTTHPDTHCKATLIKINAFMTKQELLAL